MFMRFFKTILSFLLAVCLSVIPVYAETDENREYDVLFQADIANGVTDNISFYCINDDYGDDNVFGPFYLYRVNGFKAHAKLKKGHYYTTDIRTYSSEKAEDVNFVIDEQNSGHAAEVTLKVGEGNQGEEINRNLLDTKGNTPSPTDELGVNIKIKESKKTNKKDSVKKKAGKVNNFINKWLFYIIIAVLFVIILFSSMKKNKDTDIDD